MSSPWRDSSGRRKATTRWSSSSTSSSASSEQCCGPECGGGRTKPPLSDSDAQGAAGGVSLVPAAAPQTRAQRTSLPAMWKWGTNFLPAMVAWLQDLELLPADDTLPHGHGHVSFMELALDLKTHAGRPLPPTPQSRFTGTELSLQEKGRVMRLAVTLMGKAAGKESVLPQTTAALWCRWGRPSGRSEGTSPFHKAYGGMASSEAPADLQCREVGAAAAVTSGKAAPETKTRPGTFGQRAERQHTAVGTMPRQRRGKESSEGVRPRLLRTTSSTGRGTQRRTVQSGRA